MLTMGERITVLLKRRNMSVAELAERTGQSKQNLYGKMNRDNFREEDLHKIAAALNCTYFCGFRMEDTGETI